jgi:hypothetical protein
MRTKLSQVLGVVNAWEATGKAFFNRSGEKMFINVRDPRLWGGNPNVEHWQNANAILAEIDALHVLNFGIVIDKYAGNLVIELPRIYREVQAKEQAEINQLLSPENCD